MPAGAGATGTPRRPAGRSHARPGSSAVPLSGADGAPRRPSRPSPAAGGSHARPGSSAQPLPSGQPARDPWLDPASPYDASAQDAYPASLPPSVTPGQSRSARPRAQVPQSWEAEGRRLPSSRPASQGGRSGGHLPGLPQPGARKRRRGRRILRWVAAILVLLLVGVGARVAWLIHEVNSGLGRTEAISHAVDTADGETWLLAGSDSREGTDEAGQDGAPGTARSDTIMVVNKAPNGQTAVISIPRDTYAEIPGHGDNKINAAYSLGGAPLLVSTVEQLTGLSVDHYVEVGMGGIQGIVDAVDGVNLCLDYAVNDAHTGLTWDPAVARCRTLGGHDALMFARMRYSDPRGDIGRAERQRQVVNAIIAKALTPATLVDFGRQDALVAAGTSALTVNTGDDVWDLMGLTRAYRSASAAGLLGAPPIESLDYEPGGIGSAVLLKGTTAPDFFGKVKAGTLTPGDFQQAQS